MAAICQTGLGWGNEWLIRYSADRHCPDIRALAAILTHRCSCPGAPYRLSLGLDPDELEAVTTRFFPGAAAAGWPMAGCWRRWTSESNRPDGPCHRPEDEFAAPGHGRFSRSLLEQEEQDLCRLFVTHASGDGLWPVIFARLMARACMEPDHLWMSLGLGHRDQLTGILARHFAPLAARNDRDMRWKKFFYKLLCDEEKVWTCTASSCEICPHHPECYGPEG